MKIKSSSRRQSGENITSWVETALTNTRREEPADRAKEIADSCAEALARLVEILASKGVLTPSEVHRIAKGYPDDDAVFID